MRKVLLSASLLLFLGRNLLAYGPTGHEIVGGIADKLLAAKPAGAKVSALIDGITLEKAAVMPDEIKAWDKKGPDDPKAFPHYSDHPKIDNQLREFWRANPPTHDMKSEIPSHHWFHYTDVPIFRVEKYSDGQVGRSKWDIVHMSAYCVAVLRGETPENNPRKITKAVAILLLAHYVGDIHQPLHVGAEYFNDAGQPIDPDKSKTALEDEGGNTLLLRLSTGTPEELAHRSLKLHGFWDNDAVMENLPPLPSTMPKEQRYQQIDAAKRELIAKWSATEPKSWRLPASVAPKDHAENWANEILPLAREAHERLRFNNVRPQQQDDGRIIATGDAQEKPAPDRVAYHEWAGKVVREELHKAGWRLADLLEKSITSTTTSVAPAQVSPAPTAAITSTIAPTVKSAPTVAPAPLTNPTTAGAAPASPYGVYPNNYKEVIVAWMKGKGLETSQIDWQTAPKPVELPSANGQHLYGYLVVFNTRARNGALMQTRSALIHDGRVIHVLGFDR
jgi:hypothetical protein